MAGHSFGGKVVLAARRLASTGSAPDLDARRESERTADAETIRTIP